MAITNDPLGYGPILPFKRGASDFEAGDGEVAAQSTLALILGTACMGPNNEGEIQFNQDLGTQLENIKHKDIQDPAVHELGRYRVVEAIAKNAPWIRPTEVTFPVQDRDNFTLKIRVKYDLIDHKDPTITKSQDLVFEVIV